MSSELPESLATANASTAAAPTIQQKPGMLVLHSTLHNIMRQDQCTKLSRWCMEAQHDVVLLVCMLCLFRRLCSGGCVPLEVSHISQKKPILLEVRNPRLCKPAQHVGYNTLHAPPVVFNWSDTTICITDAQNEIFLANSTDCTQIGFWAKHQQAAATKHFPTARPQRHS